MTGATVFDVLLEVREMRGQLSTFIQIQGSQGEQLKSLLHTVSVLENRVTAIEATKKVATPWWAIVGAAVPLITLVLVFLDRLYGK